MDISFSGLKDTFLQYAWKPHATRKNHDPITRNRKTQKINDDGIFWIDIRTLNLSIYVFLMWCGFLEPEEPLKLGFEN